MANTKSAAKRARQTVRKTRENRTVLTGLKSQLKKSRATLGAAGGKAAAVTQFQALTSALDKAAKRGQIHRNAANRHKSQFAKALAKVS